jgi:hypothetical protein
MTIDERHQQLVATLDELFERKARNVDAMPIEKRKSFLAKADRINSSPVFDEILGQVADDAMRSLAHEAQTMDAVYQLRGVLIAIASIREMFAKYSADYSQIKEDEEAGVGDRFAAV